MSVSGSPVAVAAAGLLALAVAMGIGRFAFTPLLPMMQGDAGVSLAQGGYLASANYLGYLAGALWATRPAPSATAIRAALLTIGLTTLGMAFVRDFVAWAVLRALAGVASAWALVHVSSWCLGQLAPLRRPLLSGAVFSGVGCGIALAGALCLALMELGASSSQAWAGLGLASLAVAALVWPVIGASPVRQPAGAQDRGYRWTLDDLRLVFCYGAFGFGYIVPATFVPAMAKQVVQDPSVFGWAWPIFGATAAVSTLFAATWIRIFGNRRLWMFAALVMAAGVAAPSLVPGLAGVVAAAVLVGGTFMVITMAGIQEAGRVAGAHAPLLIAAMTSAFAAGQTIGPLAVSYLAPGEGGISAALLLASALLAASAIALVVPCAVRKS